MYAFRPMPKTKDMGRFFASKREKASVSREAAPVSGAPDFRERCNVLVFDSPFSAPYAGKEDTCIDGKGGLE
jgi:hypothetical protein